MAGPSKPPKKIEKPGVVATVTPPLAVEAAPTSTAVAAALAVEAPPKSAVPIVTARAKPAVPIARTTAAPAKPAPALSPSPVASASKPRPPVPPKAKPVVPNLPSQPEISKGPIPMATAAESFTTAANGATDKVQGLIADAQSRAKSAWEKSARFYEEMGEFAKGNVEALIASSKLATGAIESMGQDAVAYGRKSAEELTATVRSLSTVKSPADFFQLQSDYARKAMDDYVAESAKVSEKLVKLAGEVAQPLSSRMSLAAEKVKAATL